MEEKKPENSDLIVNTEDLARENKAVLNSITSEQGEPSSDVLLKDIPQDFDKKKKSNKGILFGLGCVGCSLLGCLGLILLSAGLLIYSGMWFMKNVLAKEPIDIPAVYLTEKEEEALKKKIESFKEELDKKTGQPVSLEYSIKEMNYLFQEKEGDKDVLLSLSPAGNPESFFFIFSAPLDSDGRKSERYYLNATGTGRLKIEKDVFNVSLEKLTVGQFTVKPGNVLDGVSKYIAEELPKSEIYQKLPYTIKSLAYYDSVFKFVMSAKEAEAPAQTTPALEVTGDKEQENE